MSAKKIMFVMRKAPHGTVTSHEGLEAALAMAAYEMELSMVFIGDGVFSIVKGQKTEGIGIKGFIKTYPAIEDCGVTNVYVDRLSMESRALTADDFAIQVKIVESARIATIMEEQDALLSF